jgi:hypothetical protein
MKTNIQLGCDTAGAQTKVSPGTNVVPPIAACGGGPEGPPPLALEEPNSFLHSPLFDPIYRKII